MKIGSSYLPLPTTELSNLEDLLAEGTVFQIHAFPSEASIPQKGASIETLKATEQQYQALIAAELEHKRLLTLYPEKELKTSLTKMYRAAKSAAEENGVSSLYLAFGLLKWHDPAASASKASEYYAPIVMIPVELIRKSANDGYVLQASDEAADVNVTLLEFLRQNFEIDVEGLDPLPTDDSGLDLKKIFAHIRHAIMNRPGWDVVESCCLGNFTFSQFVMWREVHNGEEFLKNCKATRALMTGDTPFAPPGLNAIDRDEAFAPVSLDASQLHAVKLAAADASFILHGPPGTGKSQTITAMIVNALAQGKRVLFVAEKMAALEVVKSRLDKLGFSAFCLELHSNKASKKETLERLQRAAELDGERFHTQYARKRKELLDRRQDLDQYRIALHKPRDFGKTLRQIVDLYESIPDRGQYVYFTPEFIDALNEPELERLRQSLSEFVHAADEIDVEALQPLEIIKEDQQFGQRMKFDLEPLLQTYLNELEAFRDALDAFAETTGLKPPLKVAEIEEARRFAKETIASQSVPDFIKTTPNLDVELRVPEGYLTIQEEFLAREGLLRKKWRDDFLVDDMARFKDEYETATVKKLFFKTWALKKLARKLQIYVKEGSDFKVEPNEIQRLLADVERFQESKRKYEAAKETLSENWRLFFQENPTKEAFQEFKKNVLEWRRGVDNPERYRSLVESGRWEETLERGGLLKERYRLLCLAQKALEEIVALKGDSDSDDWIAARIAFSKAALANLSDLKKWFAFRARRRQCQSLGLGKVCELYKKGAPDSALVDVFLRSVYRRLAVGIIDSEPFLNEFSGTNFNLWIKRFKELDEEFMEIVKLEALNRLYERRENELRATPTVLEELKNLKKWSKSSRNVALRTIFTQIPTILPALCPCMLMSPLSVAQYLEAKNDMFDLVIFDEASQIPTCKAVGTIARAKNAVIAGDPLQMPPTSFFAVGDSSDDEATVLTEDLKSVLDDCLALGMHEAVLRWHYRSRHESLIAFSNKEFYEPEGKAMSTFPSVNDRERRVKFVKVEGIFERGRKRVNRQEAEAIVAEIKRRFADPTLAEFSIGVVTFNAPQQELIEDMLQEECQRDPEFDAWVNDGKGALFVKNLENVQGDERDVILFSIAFAPDADGKFLLNFGPINKDGGWKRLNVAVTRARSEMVVFSSITYDMIDQRRTKAKGVNALRNFLEFAQKGTLRGEYVETTARKNEGILEKICQRLAEKGYKFQRGIGRSSFKIDLGVVNPVDEDEYILGILLDGDVYFKTLDPKDREISQKAALENLGWNVYRIWTMDWWEDSEKELEKLLATLEELKQKNEPSSADSDADANSDSDAN